MDRNAATLLEFISRLTYSVDGLSAKLRLYYSQFLTFHFSKTLSINQIQEIENRRASTRFANEEEIAAVGRELSVAEKCWAIAAIGLLRSEAERLDDRVVSRRLAHLIADLTRVLELVGHVEAIGVERQSIKEEIQKYEERPIVRIPAAIWPMSLDFILRCASLLYLSIQDLDKSTLAPLNTPVIPAIVIILVMFFRRRNRKANLRLLESYGGAEKFKIEFHVSSTQYTWLAFYLIASTFISYLLAGTDTLGESIHVGAFVAFLLYYSVYLRFFNVGKINENDLVRQLDEKEQRTDTLNVDENDEMIVGLETRLSSSTSRLDAYVLESALFGALTFSGFLQIMASNLVSFTDLEAFASNVFITSKAFILLDGEGFETGLALLNNKVSLFCLISVESLVCSIFFMAVIASRLRFSDIADKVRTAINLARAFNEKEEALYHESETSDVRHSRLLALTAKVNRQLFEAGQSLRRIEPVMAYMQYFRTAGILVFVIILISSSLFITSALGWTFLAAVVATYFYFNREQISLTFKATFLQLRILFLRWSLWLFFAAIAPFIIAIVIRNGLERPGRALEMAALGYLLVGLFAPIWLLLASHYDQDFGDIEKKENRRRAGRWNIVRNLIAVGIFTFCMGMCLKLLRYGGADELIMIGVSLVTFLMYFAGYYLSKVKWLGVVSGAMLGTASIGLLFKTLHLDGAVEMLLIGVIGSFALLTIIILKRKAFHSLYLRVCLVVLFLTFTMWTNAVLRLELAYAHRTVNVAQFFVLFAKLNDDFLSNDANTREAIKSTDSYITKYRNTVPFHVIYMELVRSYNHLGREGLLIYMEAEAKDTTILNRALTAVRERDKILELYDYPGVGVDISDLGVQADILLLLNRRDEAEASLNALLPNMKYDVFRDEVLEKLAAIKSVDK